ncbi:hypothetical protein ILUMI_26440 [Ignelater luminosus]|uniref:RNA-directed DNA polymerase n=1 Tax=Ignelater luminosus TaxID=2038154 RepID=A0A8K0C6H7_IGNLU|nr:hypothetical protein ILUMI_26440 [Ignelater luminosus]
MQGFFLNKIKEMVKSDDFLVHFSNNLPIVLATDASPVEVDSVLFHIMLDGSEKPIQFASQTLSSFQRKWAQIDKEACAIIFGIKRFHQYLFGLPVMTASRMQHYAIFLQSFDFEIRYKNSKLNANADVFSRLPVVRNPNESELSKETASDAGLGSLLLQLQENVNIPQAVRFGVNQTEFTIQSNCILRGSRVNVSIARSFCSWPGLDADIKSVVENCTECANNKNNPFIIKHHWIYPSVPCEMVHVDFAGPFLGVYFLIYVDAFPKWSERKHPDTFSKFEATKGKKQRLADPSNSASTQLKLFEKPQSVSTDLRHINQIRRTEVQKKEKKRVSFSEDVPKHDPTSYFDVLPELMMMVPYTPDRVGNQDVIVDPEEQPAIENEETPTEVFGMLHFMP